MGQTNAAHNCRVWRALPIRSPLTPSRFWWGQRGPLWRHTPLAGSKSTLLVFTAKRRPRNGSPAKDARRGSKREAMKTGPEAQHCGLCRKRIVLGDVNSSGTTLRQVQAPTLLFAKASAPSGISPSALRWPKPLREIGNISTLPSGGALSRPPSVHAWRPG